MSEDENVPNGEHRDTGGVTVEHDQAEVHAPVPDPDDDLSHLAVFEADVDGAGPENDRAGASGAAYDDETDLAVPVHEPNADTAFTPFGASVPDPTPQPAYDIDRDTGL